MAEHLEETPSTVASNRQLKKDGDMTAFNKLSEHHEGKWDFAFSA